MYRIRLCFLLLLLCGLVPASDAVQSEYQPPSVYNPEVARKSNTNLLEVVHKLDYVIIMGSQLPKGDCTASTMHYIVAVYIDGSQRVADLRADLCLEVCVPLIIEFLR